MNLNKINIQKLKFFLKGGLSVACYLVFALYTIPVYQTVTAHFEKKIFPEYKTININEYLLYVEIADTEEKRIQGLSGRKTIAPDEGMLFVFKEKGENNIWMKDMNFSIDIIWLDEKSEIIYFVENAAPESYPDLLGTSKESKFVLEVPAGYIKLTNLKVGDKIDLY